ncbi:TIGR03757 family integrating conjugative element protein [Pistricoccus aurantiacus]|uniref:TIGR03757 family integrating conjugative element protein n=1 Tax=Pistricoccus aurantiacus TaxID=1883414 RepID=A0A5B8SUD2_9GAMM|nr:TIGR03757 family integrating conjugative element protein [Pistricoccus aurantiacus]QEA39627.1 TIGR03757 family integrating conjugative element protein [Pistricoccus aurantiacus]
MPTASRRPRAVLSSLCLVTVLLWSAGANAGVEVFTIAGEPVIHVPDDAAVIELDAPARLDARLSRDLPTDSERAKQVLQSRMSGPQWRAMLERYRALHLGVARAWMLGIEKVPAVVVDGQYVVYGEPDVGLALEAVERTRGRTP